MMFDHLCTKVKIGFYCLNEAFFAIISDLGLSSTSLLLVYLVNSPKKRLQGTFWEKKYLHANEQGKTRS